MFDIFILLVLLAVSTAVVWYWKIIPSKLQIAKDAREYIEATEKILEILNQKGNLIGSAAIKAHEGELKESWKDYFWILIDHDLCKIKLGNNHSHCQKLLVKIQDLYFNVHETYLNYF